MKSKFTIKNRLNITALGVLLLLIVLGIITSVYVKKVGENYEVIALVDAITKNQLKLRKAEKDFIQNDLDNINFYESNKSIFITDFDSIFGTVNEQITLLESYHTIEKIINEVDITELKKRFADYNDQFQSLISVAHEKGFKDYGLVGKMRAKIHDVESYLEKLDNSDHYMVYMLTLRRHEKDYLLRKDLKYRVKFNSVIKSFENELNNSTSQENQLMTSLLYDYKDLFSQVIEKDIQIGLNPNEGIVKRLNKNNYFIDKRINELQLVVKDESKKQISQAINIILIVALIMFLSIVFIIRHVSNYINASIKYLHKYITRLGNGELPDKIEIAKNDEISDMIRSINVLTENLKNTRTFANEVGNGNLETEVNVFNNQGDLGSSLVEMRKKLLEVAKERAQNEEENLRRNWVNEGVAKFGEILRINNQDLERLGYDILSNLIEYLDANQGVIYIINNDHEDKSAHYLELLAAIAYGRKKFMKDKVLIGEDVIGRCAYERKTIYMTKLPEDYIKITSGLGHSVPRSALIVPLLLHEELFGVIELASFNEFEAFQIEFVERIAKNIATTVSHLKINKHTEQLLKQAQEQSEEIAAQEEELRQNMEELQATQEEAARRENEVNKSLDAINSNVYISSLDMSGNISQINEAFLAFFNLPAENMLEKQFASFFTTDRTSDEFIEFWYSLQQGRSLKRENMAVLNDQQRWLKTTYIPMTDSEGIVNQILTISYDITETMKLKEEIERLKKQKGEKNSMWV